MMDDHYKRVGANKISSNYGGHPNLHGVYMIGTARGGGGIHHRHRLGAGSAGRGRGGRGRGGQRGGDIGLIERRERRDKVEGG
jgi:hypothetical protein